MSTLPIQPGQFARYENINHGLKVDVVYSGQGMDIGMGQNVAAQVREALGPNNALKGVEVQPAQDGAKLPSDTPNKSSTSQKEVEYCTRL
ncbi:hypothetical protein IC220_04535 [Wolbachia endosymbiont of Pentalonia nigronervosa]|uniref:hypothetical protein n=1 Tax=Wolbachia endosymbiont of Pentalonia nigronervosa TaxID=1301914 RepID=UPI00165FD0A9|nr:hypothetical protein [Wolbachia endosymbiont of Pentalonia nigronervosa]MBD0391711.1 hypothetical protein [Wolbachia endosymbiont of Pentalonia nigronervosa]